MAKKKTEDEGSLKIIHLRSDNVKNLVAIDITPDPAGGAIVLRGENGAGKSAVLDSILMPLIGKKVVQPIRKGQRRAKIDIDMGDYRVKQLLTATGSRLEITGPDGVTYRSPRALLDKIVGKIGFDPSSFATQKPAEQRKILMALAKLDLSKIEQARQETYEQRTQVNRQLRDIQGELENMEPPAKGTPIEEISIGLAVGNYEALLRAVDEHKEWWVELEKTETALATGEAEVQQLERQIEVAKELNKTAAVRITELQAKESASPDPVDLLGAKEAIDNAEQQNQAVRNAVAYREKQAKAESLECLSEKMTDDIQDLDDRKIEKISKTKYPIAGLSVDDEQVLYKDLPLSDLSSGEQIRVSTAVAMALNPKLRVIIVREGSLLDEAGQQAIQELAKEKGYQLWIECVGKSGAGILIEAGEIVETK